MLPRVTSSPGTLEELASELDTGIIHRNMKGLTQVAIEMCLII